MPSENLPVLIKIIFFFEDKQEVAETEILANFGSDINFDTIIGKLIDKRVLIKDKNVYKRGTLFGPVFEKMQEVHKYIIESDLESEINEWIMRGSLIEIHSSLSSFGFGQIIFLPSNLLFEILPFEKKNIEEFLFQEANKGLLEVNKILSIDIQPSRLYFRSPYWFYKSLVNLTASELHKLKESWRIKGLKIYEEEFIFGFYTREIVNKAHSYLQSRNDVIKIIKEKTPKYRLLDKIETQPSELYFSREKSGKIGKLYALKTNE